MISAVVINWNGKHYLEDCLKSVLCQSPSPDEVVMVDNHSDDGSREFVAERFPQVRVVDVGYNAGPAYARNLGVEAARYDRVLLVDNDVALQEGALRSMVATLEANPEVAVVQPRSVCADRPDTVHYDATDIHFLGLLVLHNWFVPLAEAKEPVGDNGGLVALCFLTERERFLRIGGFNPDLFILFEDTDLAWRLRMAGEQIRLDTGAIVHHGGGTKNLSMRGAQAEYPPQRVYLHSRNRWMVLLTCLHWRSLVFLMPAELTYGMVQFLFACAKGHPLAWLRGKFALLRLLPRVWKFRSTTQSRRQVPDRELLVARPLTFNPGLAERGLARIVRSCMDAGFAGWWKMVRRLCG